MWEPKITTICVATWLLWVGGVAAIVAGGILSHSMVGELGLALIGGAMVLTILQDNQRTRRMLARPREVVAPMLSVPRE